jgi:hypothetical protein
VQNALIEKGLESMIKQCQFPFCPVAARLALTALTLGCFIQALFTPGIFSVPALAHPVAASNVTAIATTGTTAVRAME